MWESLAGSSSPLQLHFLIVHQMPEAPITLLFSKPLLPGLHASAFVSQKCHSTPGKLLHTLQDPRQMLTQVGSFPTLPKKVITSSSEFLMYFLSYTYLDIL